MHEPAHLPRAPGKVRRPVQESLKRTGGSASQGRFSCATGLPCSKICPHYGFTGLTGKPRTPIPGLRGSLPGSRGRKISRLGPHTGLRGKNRPIVVPPKTQSQFEPRPQQTGNTLRSCEPVPELYSQCAMLPASPRNGPAYGLRTATCRIFTAQYQDFSALLCVLLPNSLTLSLKLSPPTPDLRFTGPPGNNLPHRDLLPPKPGIGPVPYRAWGEALPGLGGKVPGFWGSFTGLSGNFYRAWGEIRENFVLQNNGFLRGCSRPCLCCCKAYVVVC